MAQIKINIPGYKELDGDVPIVILGPNGSGKTQLAQKIASSNQVSPISAQRRTWVNDNLPVQEETQLQRETINQINQWRQNSWQPTSEIDHILSRLIQDHTNTLTKRNEEAIESGQKLNPVTDTKLILLQILWNRLFPKRKLEIGGFFPKAKRLDMPPATPSYQLKQMSDGERTILYMAARILMADQPVILVDEPELHMHSRLAVQFWDEAEKLRPDCRFIYITHDLNFTLSRRGATILIARANDQAMEVILSDGLPSSVAAEVLGAATLPFYAKRIFLFEGESGKGFASEFFSAWFEDNETFIIPCGNRDSVCAAVSGLKAVGIVAADIIGLVDRDFYSDAVLGALTEGVVVLPLHEIESVLCDQKVVAIIAEHSGKDPEKAWSEFIERVRREFRGQTLNNLIAQRVRSRVGDLLDGAFSGEQITQDLTETAANHSTKLSAIDLTNKISEMFLEESKRVEDALADSGPTLLAILPGKHMLSILTGVLGYKSQSEITNLVARCLSQKNLTQDNALLNLGTKLGVALSAYLPARRV